MLKKLLFLVLPLLAIGICTSSAFATHPEKLKTAEEIEYEMNRDFLLITAGICAYQQVLGTFSLMEEENSDWRKIMSLCALAPVPGHYFGLLLGEPQGVHPLLKMFSALAVCCSTGHAMGTIWGNFEVKFGN